MGSPNNNKINRFYLALSVIFFMIFMFLKAQKVVTDDYFEVFYYIIFGVTVMFALMQLPPVQKVFSLNKTVDKIPLSKNYKKKIVVGVGLGIVFALIPIMLGSQIIDIPQPFLEQSFTVLSSNMQKIYKFFFQSVIPGFFEEAAVYLECLAIQFILIGIFLKKSKKPFVTFVLITLISAGIGAASLTAAHSFVYGSDSAAYMGIFVFEFVVQSANLFTGTFISWIPHITHNATVTYLFYSLIVFGGQALMLIPVRKRWLQLKST